MDAVRPKIVLDLCGGSGSWSRPFAQEGYDVRLLTLPTYDVTKIRKTCLLGVPSLWLENETKTGPERFESIPIDKIWGILAAPPCTEFSVLNCKAEPRQRKPEKGMIVVNACLQIIEWCKPEWWALENPVGYLREYLGNPTLTFQPWEYGDPWTKHTDIWGRFNIPSKPYKRWEDVPNKLPLYTRPGRGKPNFAYLHKSAQKDIPQLAFAKPTTDADFRAITPPAFAQAFYEANKHTEEAIKALMLKTIDAPSTRGD